MTAHEEKVAVVQDFIKEVTEDGGEWLTGLNERMTRIVARGLVAQLEEIDRNKIKGPYRNRDGVVPGAFALPSSAGHPDYPEDHQTGVGRIQE